jgi:beta-phosphoglucomutase-like phosphatase (HAD superfamily)
MFTLLFAQSMIADTTCVHIRDTDIFELVIDLTDWDSVVADDRWLVTQVFVAFTSVPFKKLWAFLRNHKKRAHIMKTINEARNEKQSLKGVSANLDYIIKMEPSLLPYRQQIMEAINEAYPRYPMIAFYQQLHAAGVPIIVATNNDYETLMLKSAKLDARLIKAGYAPFIFDAAYCAGPNPEIVDHKAPNGMPAGSVAAGKDSDEYFSALFHFIEHELGYDLKKILFIFNDDKRRNVERACRVAEKEGISLLGVVRNKSDKRIIREIEKVLKKHVPALMNQLSLKPAL